MPKFIARWTVIGLVLGLIAALSSRMPVWQDALVVLSSTAIGYGVGSLIESTHPPRLVHHDPPVHIHLQPDDEDGPLDDDWINRAYMDQAGPNLHGQDQAVNPHWTHPFTRSQP